MADEWSNPAVTLVILQEQATGFSGIFGYSPTPGLGNLIFSVAAAAGTDPYGNTYPQGISGQGNISIFGTAALLIYNGTPELGNLIGSWAAAPGTDAFGNTYTAGITASQGTLTGVTVDQSTITNSLLTGATINGPTITNPTVAGGSITETTINFDSSAGVLLCYTTTTTTTTQSTAGVYQETVPANVNAYDVQLWASPGGPGGGSSTEGQGSGGTGEWARDPAYAVTPGQVITYVVPAAGDPGSTGQAGGDGAQAIWDLDNLGIVANPGTGADASGNAGTGGTGSTAPSHRDGTNGTSAVAGKTGGAGGPGSPGSTGSGGAAAAPSSSSGTAGGTAGTGGGAAGGTGGNNAANGSNGSSPGGAGGGAGAGNSSSSFSKTYTVTDTYSYQGSDGTNPNQKINHNGTCYQGGNKADTFNGKAKSWLVFPYTTIQSDLSGVTLSSTKLKLNNNHTWFNSGMTVAVGWDTSTSFGSTKGDPSGGNIDSSEFHVDEGATITQGISGLGTAFKNGTAFNVVLFKNTNSLSYYGYFAGESQSGPPQITFNGTTGSGSTTGGTGADGQIKFTYTTASTLALSVAPVAGTDQFGNSYPAGIATTLPIQVGNQSTPTAVSGAAVHYATGGQPAYINPAGLTPLLSGSFGVDVSPVTVTAASLHDFAAYSIPANDAAIGAVYMIEAWWHATQGSTAQSLEFQLALAGNDVAHVTIPASAWGANSTPRGWVTGILGCITTGASATWQGVVKGSGNLLNYATATAYPFVQVQGPGSVTVDSTATNAFALRFAWGSTTGSPTITCDYSYAMRIR